MMKYLHYTLYLSGRSGLSNEIMSLEVGAVLAHLMERVLVLEGNISPSANVVEYGNAITNRYRSKVTDLFDLPIPWMDVAHFNLNPHDSKHFTHQKLSKCVFYYPHALDISSEDFLAFARGRTHFLTYPNDLTDIPVLIMDGGPEVGPHKYRMGNFSFYSYLFYLGQKAKTSVHNMLKELKPKAPLLDFANLVSKDLGDFNAVHIRRGDFKKTPGMTTLNRTPQEALEVLDYHFQRTDKLVILTDEMSDPFFDDIHACYPDSVFLDQLILDNYRKEFLDLPYHDSMALALISQLIASESKDFIGSMRSTFTALIQRARGKKGKHQPFKFLWNELPNQGGRLEPGKQPSSRCVPMKHGVMVEEYEGPYSWNRYNPRINPAWMREWPESFLCETSTTKRQKPIDASLNNGSHRSTSPHISLASKNGNNGTIHPEQPVDQVIPSKYVQIENVLPNEELQQLLAFTMQQESFLLNTRVSSAAQDYRKSRGLQTFYKSETSKLIVDRVQAFLPDVLGKLGIQPFPIKKIEVQLTVSNDQDYFKIHTDKCQEINISRELTYVYYYHREPRSFAGGELILYDSQIKQDRYEEANSFKIIEPRNNSIVFFLSHCLHEIAPVRCPSGQFADSRFTINGWVHRERMEPPKQIPDSILAWANSLK